MKDLQIVNISIEEFKKVVYSEYLKIFPQEERKTLQTIEKSFNKGITKIIQIVNNKIFIGFIIINTLMDNKYIQLDYLAILPEYQNKGYGTQAIKLLKKQNEEYDGIFVETEKLGLGINETENTLREKRVKFYQRLGFYKLNFDLKWYESLVLSPYMLDVSTNKNSEDEILKSMLKIYIATHGQEKVEKNCKIIKLNKENIRADVLADIISIEDIKIK